MTSGTPRIVQITYGLQRAGAERMVVDLSLALKARGFDITVLTATDGPLLEELEDSRVSWRRSGHDYRRNLPRAVLAMESVLRELHPDIVHTHLIASDIAGRIAARRARVKHLVSTQHDDIHRPALATMAKRISATKGTMTVAVSEHVASYCREVLMVPPDRLRVIQNGVNLRRFSVTRPRTAQNVTFGAVGNLLPVKGHANLIEAFSIVQAHLPGSRLIIAGEGPERRRLEHRIRELKMQQDVLLPGSVADIPGFLEGIDIFVHPSSAEGQGIAVLEAMAAGKPCIVTAVSSLPQIVGDAGIAVMYGKVTQLSQAMLELGRAPQRATTMGDAAALRAQARYSLDVMADSYARLYASQMDR